MKKIYVIFLLISSISFSQVKVSGTVVDEANEPIAFANVIFKGSTVGTVSDENGKFYLESDDTYTEIEVSFIGFETKDIIVKPRDFDLVVTLKEVGDTLDEVVIYSGKQPKKGNPAVAILRKIWAKKRQNGVLLYDQEEEKKEEKKEGEGKKGEEKGKKQQNKKEMEKILENVET